MSAKSHSSESPNNTWFMQPAQLLAELDAPELKSAADKAKKATDCLVRADQAAKQGRLKPRLSIQQINQILAVLLEAETRFEFIQEGIAALWELVNRRAVDKDGHEVEFALSKSYLGDLIDKLFQAARQDTEAASGESADNIFNTLDNIARIFGWLGKFSPQPLQLGFEKLKDVLTTLAESELERPATPIPRILLAVAQVVDIGDYTPDQEQQLKDLLSVIFKKLPEEVIAQMSFWDIARLLRACWLSRYKPAPLIHNSLIAVFRKKFDLEKQRVAGGEHKAPSAVSLPKSLTSHIQQVVQYLCFKPSKAEKNLDKELFDYLKPYLDPVTPTIKDGSLQQYVLQKLPERLAKDGLLATRL